jgi:hypothetical protein
MAQVRWATEQEKVELEQEITGKTRFCRWVTADPEEVLFVAAAASPKMTFVIGSTEPGEGIWYRTHGGKA